MDSISKPFSRALVLCFATLFLFYAKSISDHGTLVYRSCANQTFPSANTQDSRHTQTLSSLFQELIAHSSQSMFFKHTESPGEGEDDISGIYQCRGDITNQECHTCVNTLPAVSNSMCGQSVAARVQLQGCYLHYKLDGADEDQPHQGLLHKTCGATASASTGWEEMRRAAFGELESGSVARGGGFYKTSYELVQVMAQCEGGLGGCECGECVNSAVQIAEDECGDSLSGEIYLVECFLSFAYHPEGSYPEERRDDKGNNGRSIALVVGGVAALCFGFIFLLFIKSRGKKDDY